MGTQCKVQKHQSRAGTQFSCKAPAFPRAWKSKAFKTVAVVLQCWERKSSHQQKWGRFQKPKSQGEKRRGLQIWEGMREAEGMMWRAPQGSGHPGSSRARAVLHLVWMCRITRKSVSSQARQLSKQGGKSIAGSQERTKGDAHHSPWWELQEQSFHPPPVTWPVTTSLSSNSTSPPTASTRQH